MESPISHKEYQNALMGIQSRPATLEAVNRLTKREIQNRINRLRTGYVRMEHDNLEEIEFWVRIESLKERGGSGKA